MNIHYTIRASGQARLHQAIVLGQVAGMKRGSKLVVDQVLPSDGQTERIELIFLDEMLHLCSGVNWWNDVTKQAGTLSTSVSLTFRSQVPKVPKELTSVVQPKSNPAMLTPPHATPAATALPTLNAMVEPARSLENITGDCNDLTEKERDTSTAVLSS